MLPNKTLISDQMVQMKGKKMRKYFLLGTVLMLILSISACSTTGGRFSAQQIAESRSTVIHQAVYNGTNKVDFFQYKEGWLDPDDMIRKEANRMHEGSGGMPLETVLLTMRNMERYRLFFQLADQDLVVYRIGVDVPPDLLINFTSLGALTFTMASNQEVKDIGIVVPQDFSPISNWHDSRRRVAVLSKDSNRGKPAGVPNIIFVLMPKSSYGQRVVKVTPNKSMSFSGQASLVLK